MTTRETIKSWLETARELGPDQDEFVLDIAMKDLAYDDRMLMNTNIVERRIHWKLWLAIAAILAITFIMVPWLIYSLIKLFVIAAIVVIFICIIFAD